jgi:hypothetical protein
MKKALGVFILLIVAVIVIGPLIVFCGIIPVLLCLLFFAVIGGLIALALWLLE